MAPKTPVKVILGCHMIGDPKDPIAILDTPEAIEAVLSAFKSRGYADIDTARNYTAEDPTAIERSEKRLGEAGAASRFTIHTKVQSGTPGDHEPAKIALSIKESLEALQTPSVETMFLHVPDRQTPFEDTLKAMDDAFQQGKFKKLGISNYSPAEVEKIIEICEQKGYVKPSVYQGHYNAVTRAGEKLLFPILRKHSMKFFAYSPAAAGLFTGNFATASRWSDTNFIGKLYSSLYGQAPVQNSVSVVQDAAAKHGIDGHAAAVRWTAFHGVLDGEHGDAVIFGVSKLEQVHKTLDALEAGPLPNEVADAITAVWPTVEGFGPPFHL